MALAQKVYGDLIVDGDVAPQSIIYPPLSIDNAAIKTAAAIDGSKVLQRRVLTRAVEFTTDVADVDEIIHIPTGAGEVISVRAVPATAATNDKQVAIDLQKGAQNSSASWTSLLASTLDVDSSVSDREVAEATLAATKTYNASDLLRLVLTTSGSTGNLPKGVLVEVIVQESP